MAAFAVSTAVLWVWHLPVAYDFALSHVGIYWLAQFTLLSSALWFWRAVLAPNRTLVEALTLLTFGFAQMSLLGAILTFAPEALYAAHAVAPMSWGFTPLQDQQLGAILMWVPAGLPYAVVAGAVARRGWATLRMDTT